MAAALGAYVIWGTSPLFFKAADAAPPLEMLAHRTLWTLALLGGWALAVGRAHEIRAALADPAQRPWLGLAALTAAANWFLFIYCVTTGRAVEASLAYYLFPLMAVAAGALVWGERLGRARTLAVALAAAGVAVLAVGLGAAPWFALAIAAAFTLYGAAKRKVSAGPAVSVAIEALLLAPVAAAWLAGVHLAGWVGLPGQGAAGGAWFGRDAGVTALLIASGAVTAAPLMLFAHAARRLDYGTVGLMQYLNPTLQFAIAALIFGEAVTGWHAAALALIWAGLAVAGWAALRPSRAPA